MWTRGEMHTRFQLKNFKGRDYLGDLGVDERMILKCFLK
jgi:hypothetical protein